jgi:hypothetical protein
MVLSLNPTKLEQSGASIKLFTSITDKDFGKALALLRPEIFIAGLDFKSFFFT